MSPREKFNKLPTKLKVGLGIAATIVTLVSGVVTAAIAVDERMVDQNELIQTIEQYDLKVQQQIKNIEKDSKMRDYNRITERYYSLKRQQRMYPDDEEIAAELEEVKAQREKLKIELKL